jgi:hypothetical protein
MGHACELGGFSWIWLPMVWVALDVNTELLSLTEEYHESKQIHIQRDKL